MDGWSRHTRVHVFLENSKHSAMCVSVQGVHTEQSTCLCIDPIIPPHRYHSSEIPNSHIPLLSMAIQARVVVKHSQATNIVYLDGCSERLLTSLQGGPH